jgi:CDP-paratose 2-epimerase
MKVLITGICGFVGSSLTRALLSRVTDVNVSGIDNFVRPGSETNRPHLRELGVKLFHGDVRCSSDFEQLPDVDWVIDAAAQPSVLIGADGRTSSRQAVEHNLFGTVNILEYCKARKAGLVLLSSSRVYSIPQLNEIPLKSSADSFLFDGTKTCPLGVSARGITEEFSTAAPVSLYGSTKLASEALALEYGHTYNFPVWVNRCGVIAGAGQFGTAEQGIFSYWIHAHAQRRRLGYYGFNGTGFQVRDALHPHDLATAVIRQITAPGHVAPGQIFHLAGGSSNAMSLRQLTAWCDDRFGPHRVEVYAANRRFDVPWVVMDDTRARHAFDWEIEMTLPKILDEIAAHARLHPDWLNMTGA